VTPRGKKEKGHLLVGLMAFVAIMLITGTVATQAWVEVVRRDNEAEMMFRAQEIVRAIARFQRDQSRPPLELKELMEPGQKGQYFLRKLYDDPLVKDGKWGLLHAAPGGGIYDPANPNTQPGAQGAGGPGQQGIGMNRPGQQNRPGGIGGRSGRESAFGNFAQGGGEGLPIIGVRTLSTDTPFRVYRGSQDYAQWLFTIYDLQQPGQGDPNNPNQQGTNPQGTQIPQQVPGGGRR
jgi:type II secretory pathway pseudopilin PulG